MVNPLHVAVKGRSRFSVSGLYHSDSCRAYLETELGKRSEILRISASTLTGNVLVFHRPERTPAEIAVVISNLVLAYTRVRTRGGAQTSRMIRESSAMRRGEFKRDDSSSGRPILPKLAAKAEAQTAGRARKARRICEAAPTRQEELKPNGNSSSRRILRKLVAKAEAQQAQPWHLMKVANVLERLESNGAMGLSGQIAVLKIRKFGPNVLPESVPRSGLAIFFSQFNSLPVALLGVAAAISVCTGGIADAIVIAGVVAINAVIGYVTESGSEKTIHSLKRLVRPNASVIRDGVVEEKSTDTVVPGDVLVLRAGCYVSADARLIETQHLNVDESALTGESMPVEKTAEPLTSRPEIPLADRRNMVYMGTLVIGGHGLAVVVATGRYTEIGAIQSLSSEVKPPDTPMEKQLDHMGRQLGILSIVVCGAVFVIGMLRGYGFLEMLKSSLALAVAAVPEGLPAVATTTLALGLQNMKRQHVLIRHLEAVETLGSIQTICLDKTGTITLNKMTVRALHAGMRQMRFNDGKFTSGNDYISPYACDELLRLLHVAVLCNESEVAVEDGCHSITGSSTENALLYMALSVGIDPNALRDQHPRLHIVHRYEGQNTMTTLHRTDDPQGKIIFATKGSPREVLSLCAFHIKDGKQYRLSDEDRRGIEVANERMAGSALRVLGLAYALRGAEVGLQEGDYQNGEQYIWLGMVGMADPIRDGLKELIGQFHTAGIDTVMITGDQTPTAYAIAKELSLSRAEEMEIIDSTHLADMDPDVLRALSERVPVFSRVSPAHKLQIVQSLQRAGRVIAMTGDGINDGPALKAADVGIAMGHTGTDLAREVADVVLEDDNLQTMIVAISQGRTIYNNIRKTIQYLLSTNMSEIMLMFVAIGAGLGQPLNIMQLLWINLISDIFPGLALALEPPEPDVLTRPPRSQDEQILRPADYKKLLLQSALLTSGSLAAYGYGIVRYGIGPRASTLAFLSLSSGQLLHAINCRSTERSIWGGKQLPPNRYLNGAMAGSFVMQGLAIAVPGLRNLLGNTPINVTDGAVIAGASVLPFIVNDLAKGTRKGQLQ